MSDSIRGRRPRTPARPDVASPIAEHVASAPVPAPLDLLRRMGEAVAQMQVVLRAEPEVSGQVAESADRLALGARPAVSAFVENVEREQTALLGWFRLFQDDLDLDLRLDGLDPDAEPVNVSLRADGQAETRLRKFLRRAKAVAATQGDDVVVDARLTARKTHAQAAARELLATRPEYAGTAEALAHTQVAVYYQAAAWNATIALRSIAAWEREGWFQSGGRVLVVVCDASGYLAGIALDVIGAQAEGEPDWLVFSRAAWREFQAREQRIRQLRAEESNWMDAPGAITFDTLRAQERRPGLDETAQRTTALREALAAAYLASAVAIEPDGGLNLRFAGARPATCALEMGPVAGEIAHGEELARLAGWAFHSGASEALIIARECLARELKPGVAHSLADVAQAAGPAQEAAKANLTLYVRRNIDQYFRLRETAQEAVAAYSDSVRKAVSDLTGTIVDDAYRIVGVLAAAVIAGIVQPDLTLFALRVATALFVLYIAFVLGVVLRARWERFTLEKQALRERLDGMPELTESERMQIQQPSVESDAYFARYYRWSFWIYLTLGVLAALAFLLLWTPLASALPHK
ncbi:MAG TPA: hypothetical protein VH349_04995 [Ktedonobacterales bacterium]